MSNQGGPLLRPCTRCHGHDKVPGLSICEECAEQDFLAAEKAKRLATLEARVLERLPAYVIFRRTGASGEEIAAMAKRLGVKLPRYEYWENVLCPETV